MDLSVYYLGKRWGVAMRSARRKLTPTVSPKVDITIITSEANMDWSLRGSNLPMALGTSPWGPTTPALIINER